MTDTITTTQVAGQTFEVWGDYIKRGVMARNTETGETKQISFSGYVNNDLTVRKKIAIAFHLPTFRKTWRQK